jgi:phospholipase C
MQENRSYDHYFGLLHREGQRDSEPLPMTGNPNPLDPSQMITPFLQSKYCEVADLEHGWTATHNEINGGRMDGFTAANAQSADPSGRRAMGVYDVAKLRFYYSLAYQFSIADRYFSSVPGPTFPNRFYLLTGTSFGHIRNDVGSYDQKTIFQALDEAQPPVSWRIYMTSVQVEVLFRYISDHAAGHVFPISQYYEDAKNGTLPQVAFLESDPLGDANHESDEHPPANEQIGQKFTHDAVKALTESPNWSSSAFILTYDEHGGYADHVPPPAAVPPDDMPPMLRPGDTPAKFDQLGVRVPTLVVSPWAKRHFVSHTVYDHTSILKLIETRFGLPPLTRRDAAADPMLDLFDFSHVSTPRAIIQRAKVDPAGLAQCADAETSGEL